ncbi:MAG: DNA-3-methyladenine glycosylase [bacterium]|nr:DNA-3-methyladenine glycosylase [bacterium]
MPSAQKKRLGRSFYDRPTLEIAPEILGKVLVYNSKRGRLSARVTEVEAYIGETDPACHAFGGPTRRSQPLFGFPGTAYVYLIYGVYFCFNFVTEREGKAAALLLRGAEAMEGVEIMHENSPGRKENRLLNGPGKFCRSFGIDLTHNGLDLTGNDIYLEDHSFAVTEIGTSTRIGISKGKELMWRFFDVRSDSLSRTA